MCVSDEQYVGITLGYNLRENVTKEVRHRVAGTVMMYWPERLRLRSGSPCAPTTARGLKYADCPPQVISELAIAMATTGDGFAPDQVSMAICC